jgi:outer membrane protein, multidrug efflux system
MSTGSHRHTIRRFHPVAWVATVFGVAACATGGHYEAPDPMSLTPASFPGADSLPGPAPAERWWTVLDDPLLDELIDQALAGNPDLAGAEARVRQSRALAQVAGAAFLPELDATAQGARNEISRHSENLSLIPFAPAQTTFTDYKVGFDASWEIDLAGGTRHAVEAALARLGSAEESRNDARVVVAAEVVSDYIEYRINRERSRVASDNRAAFAETVRLVGLQHRSGLASDLDLQRAEADKLANDAVLPSVETEWHVALYQLTALAGDSRADLGTRLGESGYIPSLPSAIVAGLPSDLLRRRPDIRRADRDLAAAAADLGVAVAAQFPRFMLVGDAGLDSVHTGDLVSAASRYWDLGPQLTIPIFTAGRLRHQVEANAAARDAALAKYRSTVLNAVAEAESALVRLSAEQSRAASYAAACRALEGSLALARRRYQAGEAALTEVLDVQRSLNQLSDLRVQSAGQAVLDFVALQKALGGGWR